MLSVPAYLPLVDVHMDSPFFSHVARCHRSTDQQV